jgi:cyclopropane fatty-acyl-phospholipid synthase-like methyltransferase
MPQMKNYSLLFQKISAWLKTSGESKLFIHIFCHRTTPYHFEENDGWMSQNFFSGGTMPCHDLFLYFQQHVTLDQLWWINGSHYAKTCEAWLKKQDANNARNKSIQSLRQDAKKKGVDELEGEKTFFR